MKTKNTLLALAFLITSLSFGQIATDPGTGNVGIGTTTPKSKLEITDWTTALTIGSKKNTEAMVDNEIISAINFYKHYNLGYAAAIKLLQAGGGNNYSQAHLAFYTTSGGNVYTTAPEERMRITDIGNIGVSTTTPIQKLQIGEFNNSQNFKLTLPGVYNFEEIKLGQYGNGATGIEMISHTNLTESCGVRLFSSTDSGMNGFQIQTATPSSSSQNLNYSTKFAINLQGNVGIGTITPDEKLTVKGKIHAQEVKVDLQGACAPDYVFQKYYTGKSTLKSDYVMLTLAEIESFTKKNNHLPNVPSAQEIQEKGMSLGEMSNVLLQKVEELTLYAIEQNKEIKRLKAENENYKSLAERLLAVEKELKK